MKTRLTLTAALAAIFLSGTLMAGGTWYVDNSATGADDGTSWNNAFTDLAQAVSNVWGNGENSGSTIYVRQAAGAPDYPGGIVIADGFSDGTPGAFNAIVGWSGEGYLERPPLPCLLLTKITSTLT